MRVHEAIDETMQLVRAVNKYMEAQAPWKVAKTDLAAAGTILYTATEALRISAILLLPVMPSEGADGFEILGAAGTEPRWGELKSGTRIKTHEALFPRLEAKEISR